MHERLIVHINRHEGVQWLTMDEIAKDFKQRHPPPPGVKMPLLPEEVIKKLNINLP